MGYPPRCGGQEAEEQRRQRGELTVGQYALYRIGIHRHLGDLDTALAAARRLQPEALPAAQRRARAATDTARTLLDAGDAAAAFAQPSAPRSVFEPKLPPSLP
ncbi:hypothetical protein [Streptomyces achromogenes]|uniref:hypothetical protein n=1 Tax=Streptomyces achromogenes TaxID=67255 RepID=UPI0036845D6C